MLLVHGIWDTGAVMSTMRLSLLEAGAPAVHAIDLSPSDGSAPIPELSRQVRERAEHLGERIDLVGFSMGAIVARYFVQRLGGRERVRRFVAISGPQRGTVHARLGRGAGIRDMRPGSRLLRDLDADPDPFGEVDVLVYYTPFDLMILPATSSRLSHARVERRFPVLMHRFMQTDPRVLASLARDLSEPRDVVA